MWFDAPNSQIMESGGTELMGWQLPWTEQAIGEAKRELRLARRGVYEKPSTVTWKHGLSRAMH